MYNVYSVSQPLSTEAKGWFGVDRFSEIGDSRRNQKGVCIFMYLFEKFWLEIFYEWNDLLHRSTEELCAQGLLLRVCTVRLGRFEKHSFLSYICCCYGQKCIIVHLLDTFETSRHEPHSLEPRPWPLLRQITVFPPVFYKKLFYSILLEPLGNKFPAEPPL